MSEGNQYEEHQQHVFIITQLPLCCALKTCPTQTTLKQRRFLASFLELPGAAQEPIQLNNSPGGTCLAASGYCTNQSKHEREGVQKAES